MMSTVESLLASRKFVITALALTILGILVGLGKIEPKDFASTLQTLVSVLVATVGAEGVAEKWNAPGGGKSP